MCDTDAGCRQNRSGRALFRRRPTHQRAGTLPAQLTGVREKAAPMSGTAHLPQIAKIASIPQSVNYETISVTPTSPHIGAEIGSIDLTRPLSNKQVAELHDAFARYMVIFFRD